MTERDVSLRQGDVYWIDVGDLKGSEPGYRRPYVVVQNDVLNQSRLRTVVVCAVTSNPRRAAIPGNVSLEPGEAGLSHPSIVNVTQIYTVDKSDLEERAGSLSPRRLRKVLDGVALVLDPRELS